MSASFYRPAPRLTSVVRGPWSDSRDALDLSAEIVEAAGDIGASGNTLFHYPTNAGAIRDARAAARRVLALCARLEEITAP